jgi:hypothetical protein
MATKYAKAAGGNWSASATWSATGSGGADSAGAPAAGDDVIFQSGSTGLVTIDTATCVGKTLTCQGSGNQIAFSAGQKLTISGNVTFVSGMSLTGTGKLVINAAATLTSGGVTFPGDLAFNINGTISLGDAWTVTGTFVVSTNTTTINSNSMALNGGMVNTGGVAGSARLDLKGGTWSGDVNHASPITIAGNVTFSGRVRLTNNAVVAYTSGTLTLSGSILYLNGTISLNLNGTTIGNIQLIGGTITLLSNFVLDTFLMGGGVGLGNPTLAGVGNVTCVNFINQGASLTANGTAANVVLTVPTSSTITVTTKLSLTNDGAAVSIAHIKTATASGKANLVYQGTRANMCVCGMTFTDIDASGSAVPIENMNGGTLTRTTNINNRTWANILDLIGAIV